MNRRISENGYTLIELVLVLVIVGILASVGLKSLGKVNQTTRIEETKREMERLAWAISGNPALVSGGSRVDFGYVGDVGGLPPTLDALVANPGVYATWHGPYLVDEFTSGGANTAFLYDAWGVPYAYTGGSAITSTGGGMTLTRQIAPSTSHLILNNLDVVVVDLDQTPPGLTYADSLLVVLTVPNGSGSYSSRSRTPRYDGSANFDSIPIGIHELRVIYSPTADTLLRQVIVCPNSDGYVEMVMPANLWSGS